MKRLKEKIYWDALTSKKNQLIPITIRITPQEHQFIQEVKKDTKCSTNLFIRVLINERRYEYEANE